MSGRGRTVRTPEAREAILRNLRAGVTREDAASYAGINRATLFRWLRADATLVRACEEAEAYARVRATTVVVDDAFGRPAVFDDRGNVIRAEVKPNVASAMWYLERRDPMNWGKRVTVDVRRIVERLAVEAGFDVDDVMAEVQSIYDEHAQTTRST